MRDPEELAAIRARDARLIDDGSTVRAASQCAYDRRALLNMLDEAREAFDALNMEYSGCDCCGYEEAKAALDEAREFERSTRVILDGYKLAAETGIKERDEARRIVAKVCKHRDEAREENKWLRMIVDDEFGDGMSDTLIERRKAHAAAQLAGAQKLIGLHREDDE